jgi:hypothetical protein
MGGGSVVTTELCDVIINRVNVSWHLTGKELDGSVVSCRFVCTVSPNEYVPLNTYHGSMVCKPGINEAHNSPVVGNCTHAFQPIFSVNESGLPVINTAASNPTCPIVGTAIDNPGIGVMFASPARIPVMG